MAAKKTSTGEAAKANSDWLVYRLGGARAALLGTVTAPNEATALAKAYDEFNVTTPAERKRIIVLQMGKA